MADVTLPPRFEYTEQVEKLIKLLEDQGAEVGWSDLGEVVIDYLEDELSHGMLVHRYKCTPGRATRILSILNNATGRNYVPITSKLSKVASALLAHGEIALASEVLALLKKAGEFHYQVSVYPGSVDDENTSLGYSELADAASRAAQKDFADTMGPAGLAEYIGQSDERDKKLYGKVISIYDPVIRIDPVGRVTTLFQVNTSAELSSEEEEALKGYILGQCSDGWGEGFEQWPIKVSDGDIRLSPWTSGAEATVEKKGGGAVASKQGLAEGKVKLFVTGTNPRSWPLAKKALDEAGIKGYKPIPGMIGGRNAFYVIVNKEDEEKAREALDKALGISDFRRPAKSSTPNDYWRETFDDEKVRLHKQGSMEAVHEYAKVAFPHIKAAAEAMLDLGDWGADFGDEGGAYEALLDKFDAVYEGFKKLSEGQKLT